MSYTIEDLLPYCKKCEGSGEMENPILKQQNKGSYGTRIVSASLVDCDNCNGSGVIPSEFGTALIEFINGARSKHLEGV